MLETEKITQQIQLRDRKQTVLGVSHFTREYRSTYSGDQKMTITNDWHLGHIRVWPFYSGDQKVRYRLDSCFIIVSFCSYKLDESDCYVDALAANPLFLRYKKIVSCIPEGFFYPLVLFSISEIFMLLLVYQVDFKQTEWEFLLVGKSTLICPRSPPAPSSILRSLGRKIWCHVALNTRILLWHYVSIFIAAR